jgi:hypothetical protein
LEKIETFGIETSTSTVIFNFSIRAKTILTPVQVFNLANNNEEERTIEDIEKLKQELKQKKTKNKVCHNSSFASLKDSC